MPGWAAKAAKHPGVEGGPVAWFAWDAPTPTADANTGEASASTAIVSAAKITGFMLTHQEKMFPATKVYHLERFEIHVTNDFEQHQFIPWNEDECQG